VTVTVTEIAPPPIANDASGRVCCHSPSMPFPLNALPSWLRDMVQATARFAQAQVDMAAVAAIGTLSAAVGRKGWVTLGRRRFPLHLWIMVVGESGDGKSTVFSELSEPLGRIQRVASAPASVSHPPVPTVQGRPAWERLDTLDEHEMPAPSRLLDDATAVVRAALTASGSETLRLLLDDITPTTLIDLLGSQVTGSALISPEGGFESWLAQGGPVAGQNAATLNRVWDGADFTRERQGRTVPVERPALTLLVGMQPEPFADFLQHRTLRSRGFTLRFLFVRSEALRREYPAPEIDEDVREAFDSAIYRLVSLAGWPPHQPFSIRVSEGAARLNADFLNQLEDRIQAGGDLAHGHPYARRFGSNLLRLAGLLHLARNIGTHGGAVVDLPIDEPAMTAAIEVATYFVEQGVAALAQPGRSARVSLLDAIEVLLRDPPSWTGTAVELVVALERAVPLAHRSGWPRGENNVMRVLRAHGADLAERGITLHEERTNSARCILLSRSERATDD
jgi:hypothetical protein